MIRSFRVCFFAIVSILLIHASNNYPVLYAINIVGCSFVMLYCICRILMRADRGGVESSGKYLFACIFVGLAFLIKIGDVKYNFYSMAKISLLYRRQGGCVNSSAVIDRNNRLSVCYRKDWDRWGYVESIVYDSSDQIIQSTSKRSAAWEAASISLDRKAPFGILGFTAWRLTGHYYLVRFYYDADPN